MASQLVSAARRALRRSRPRRDRHSLADTAAADTALLAELRAAIGNDRVRGDAATRYLASRDASIFAEGSAGPVCYPGSTDQVVACVKIAARHGRGIVPRGAGTGLSGGAVPLGRPVVVSLTGMNDMLSLDLDNRIAWVQPGTVNLQLSRRLAPHGLHFAPDPSSQAACTIGGNVANNSGGPHCLAYGVTSAHVVALEVVLSDGAVATLGGVEAEPSGYDLRGAYIGSEGMCGITTAAAVRLTPNPPAVCTMLLCFGDVAACASTVTAIIAAGIVPAAIEMMDRRCVAAIERFAQAGYPSDAEAVLLVEVDGPPGGVAIAADRVAAIARDGGATSVRVAANDDERAKLWKGRKSAFGAVANIEPDYYLHDTVVPRTRLAEALQRIYEIVDRHDLTVLNVFHAGDGNLHPILAYDSRVDGANERVQDAGREIIEMSLDMGGALSGEHGIGVEKRDFMDRMFSEVDLNQQHRLRAAFDPHCRMNPGKVLPSAHSCSDIASLRAADASGVWG